MAKRGFLTRHGIVRNAIKKDLLYFFPPWLLLFFAGLLVSAEDGWVELPPTLWELIRRPRSLFTLSLPNIAGISLFVFGFTVLLIAQITLGRSYSSTLIIRKDHQLITHGIYHFIRHPIYLGVILVSLSLPLYASSLVGLLIMSTLVPVFLIRIKLEERLLTEAFDDAYRAYQQATHKLIPFIY